ncbi:MAG: 30S ribosomal protein S7 [bacterium]|nr:30S ribosomal protein S7 [bacterium]
MSRKNRADQRKVAPDPVYNSVLVSKFINGVMLAGKRAVAEQIFYDALDEIKEKAQKDPIELFNSAVDNVKPALEVRSRRVGGATYQVPVEVRQARQQALAIRWLVGAARDRGERSMKAKLAAELLDAANNQGNAIKKKQDTHRMAEANKAFAHYRW